MSVELSLRLRPPLSAGFVLAVVVGGSAAPTVQGYWREETRNISGQLTGRLEGGRFQGAVSGPGFSAGISLWSNSRRQAVNIQPSAGGGIADVRIELERRG